MRLAGLYISLLQTPRADVLIGRSEGVLSLAGVMITVFTEVGV
jgi:hypothetical protein